MISETINWILVSERRPESEVTVLLHAPDASEPVWPGYREADGSWTWADGTPSVEEVVAWAEMPVGSGQAVRA